eukprot:2451786-Pleurochrysis_carterae.AAC.1
MSSPADPVHSTHTTAEQSKNITHWPTVVFARPPQTSREMLVRVSVLFTARRASRFASSHFAAFRNAPSQPTLMPRLTTDIY